MLKEQVHVFAENQKLILDIDDKLRLLKEKFEKDTALLKQSKLVLEEKQKLVFSEIEGEIKTEFKNNPKVKKFYGGFGVQERKELIYDEEKALSYAKQKDICLQLDVKAFEKVAETLKLDFVEIKTNVKVTTPKEIKLELLSEAV